jgi:hypothetical protein
MFDIGQDQVAGVHEELFESIVPIHRGEDIEAGFSQNVRVIIADEFRIVDNQDLLLHACLLLGIHEVTVNSLQFECARNPAD